jgi:uncharacterized protein YjdB
MTFKHKLSMRLAMLRDTALAAALVVVACITPADERMGPSGSLTRIAILPDSLTVQQGQVVEFVAVGLTSAGDTANVSVRWTVTGGAITEAGIRSGRAFGRFKPDRPGQHQVKGTNDSTGLSDSSVVTVPAPVVSVTVAPASASLTVGQTVQLSATLRDSAGTVLTGRVVSWTTSASGVATVNGSGLVNGVGVGTATITATSEGKSGTASVSVAAAPVASVSVTPSSASVGVGQSVQLTATPRDASGNPLLGRAVSWSSSAPTVATVSGSGLVSGAAVGAATIMATSEGQSGTASVTVSVPVASVTVTPASPSVAAGTTVQLTATLRDTDGNALSGRPVTWSSNAAGVATVSASGLVTGVGAGTATITATSEGKTGTSTITVTPAPVASVTVSPATANVSVGGTVQLTATPRDAGGNPLSGRVVTWSTSQAAVATVSGAGLVTAVAVGSATITASSEGKSGTAAVTVTTAPPPGAAPWLEQDFRGFGSTAELRGDCTAFQGCVEDKNVGQIFLDQGVGVSALGLTQSMRYDFIAPGCTAQTVGRAIALPSVAREVWVELYLRWSPNFTTKNVNGCATPPAHKLFFGYVTPDLSGRWALDWGQQGHLGVEGEWPRVGWAAVAPSGAAYWDGNWHRVRLHWKFSSTTSASDGAYQLWIDDALVYNNQSVNTTAGTGLQWLTLGRNLDQGIPSGTMSLWWGRIRTWNTTPDW